MFRTVRMIATATITLWAAAAAAEGPATPGREPGPGEVTTGSPAPGPSQAAPQATPASPQVPAASPQAPAASPQAPAATPQAPPAPPQAPPAQPQAAPNPAAPPPGATGTPATVLDTQDYEGVLGKAVRSSTGEDMGRIIDIILDKDGRPRAAIIDFGGFLGVGSRKIAVDWRAMRFTPDGKPSRLVLQLSRNQVRVSPEYKPGDPIVVLGPASPAPPAEGEQAASPVQGPALPVQTLPAQAPPAPGPAPVAPPEKAPDKPAERSPER